jgi:hypothetical protein
VEGRCELVRNELFESVRPTVVLAAFSLENFRSFNELRDKVLPAVRTRFNDLPVLVVGTKSDTRHPSALDSFFQVAGAGPDYQQGVALAYELGAKDYVECSILTREGLGSVLGATAELGTHRAPLRPHALASSDRPHAEALTRVGSRRCRCAAHAAVLCAHGLGEPAHGAAVGGRGGRPDGGPRDHPLQWLRGA